jgi:hypothetical protein
MISRKRLYHYKSLLCRFNPDKVTALLLQHSSITLYFPKHLYLAGGFGLASVACRCRAVKNAKSISRGPKCRQRMEKRIKEQV